MKPRKKGKQYEISYRCPGCDKPFYERFPTLEEAKIRCAEIELAQARGDLRPPKKTDTAKKEHITVGELLDEYVELYGLNHWGDSYLSCSRHRIEHYIKPYLGDMRLQHLTPHDFDVFYNLLLLFLYESHEVGYFCHGLVNFEQIMVGRLCAVVCPIIEKNA